MLTLLPMPDWVVPHIIPQNLVSWQHYFNKISLLINLTSSTVPIEIEPDPEPEIPSPTHNIPRGPSPEAKPDDTECHRSQSAM